MFSAFLAGCTSSAPRAHPVDVPSAGRTHASAAFELGWTELLLPPEVRAGAALVWADGELLAWGGCRTQVGDICEPTTDGFRFDPSDGRWRPLSSAPEPGANAHAEWTGTEALFLFDRGGHLSGMAYEPSTDAWRTLPRAPIEPRRGGTHVWTGDELIVWGGGTVKRGLAATGAAYDPRSDSWRRIPDAPIGLNLASGVWTGQEMIVFGSLLDNRNRAQTRTSIGAAYDPATDAWRRIPPSALSPQATSAVIAGDSILAWDYDVEWQLYDPEANAWGPPGEMPLEFSECYPYSEVVGRLIFAFFCGQAALYDPGAEGWAEVRGGMLAEEIRSDAFRSGIKKWRFADLASAEGTLFLLAEGITLSQGEPCYGCEGSPHSFWAYRPRDDIHPRPGGEGVGATAARELVYEFMDGRVFGGRGLIPWSTTQQVLDSFGDTESGLPQRLFAGRRYRVGGLRRLDGRPIRFSVDVRLILRGAQVRERLLLGPGRAAGGATLPLVVVDVRRLD